MKSATPDGTRRYAERMRPKCIENHFNKWPQNAKSDEQFYLSRLGIGTYTGNEDDETDASYVLSIMEALTNGVQIIDCAINYRNMRSERAVGTALRKLMDSGAIQRDEIWVMTKGGYLPFDGDFPEDPAVYIIDTYIRTGLLTPEDIVGGCHAIAPKFLKNQLDRSLSNLGLPAVDVYFIHNIEQQLEGVSHGEFINRMTAAFAMCEEAVSEGKAARYGIATWDGFRVNKDGHGHLSLDELVRLAESVGGKDHHFKVIQLPFNLAMPEALISATQRIEDQPVCILEAAEHHNMAVVTSVPLLQKQILPYIPPHWENLMPGLKTPAQRALQFVRSTPGILAPLVGMKSLEHVQENCSIARAEPLDDAQYRTLLH
jgi:aryl-alcohol dehydrogenase-like predicted oxidoreductase